MSLWKPIYELLQVVGTALTVDTLFELAYSTEVVNETSMSVEDLLKVVHTTMDSSDTGDTEETQKGIFEKKKKELEAFFGISLDNFDIERSSEINDIIVVLYIINRLCNTVDGFYIFRDSDCTLSASRNICQGLNRVLTKIIQRNPAIFIKGITGVLCIKLNNENDGTFPTDYSVIERDNVDLDEINFNATTNDISSSFGSRSLIDYYILNNLEPLTGVTLCSNVDIDTNDFLSLPFNEIFNVPKGVNLSQKSVKNIMRDSVYKLLYHCMSMDEIIGRKIRRLDKVVFAGTNKFEDFLIFSKDPIPVSYLLKLIQARLLFTNLELKIDSSDFCDLSISWAQLYYKFVRLSHGIFSINSDANVILECHRESRFVPVIKGLYGARNDHWETDDMLRTAALRLGRTNKKGEEVLPVKPFELYDIPNLSEDEIKDQSVDSPVSIVSSADITNPLKINVSIVIPKNYYPGTLFLFWAEQDPNTTFIELKQPELARKLAVDRIGNTCVEIYDVPSGKISRTFMVGWKVADNRYQIISKAYFNQQ